MCSELDPTSGDFGDTGVSISDFDPTTSSGLTNLGTAILTGGASIAVDAAGGDTAAEAIQGAEEFIKEKGDKLADFVTGKDEQDALEAAAAAQESAAQQGIDFGKEQYADFLGFTAPYREAGESFLPQLTEFLDPEVQDTFRANALQSEGFQSILGQTTENLLSESAAFGGLRSSGTQDRIIRETSNLANRFGQQAVDTRLNQLQGGVNLGLGTLGTTISGLGQAGSQIQGGIQNLGNAQSAQAIAAGQSGFGFGDLLNVASVGANIYGASQA